MRGIEFYIPSQEFVVNYQEAFNAGYRAYARKALHDAVSQLDDRKLKLLYESLQRYMYAVIDLDEDFVASVDDNLDSELSPLDENFDRLVDKLKRATQEFERNNPLPVSILDIDPRLVATAQRFFKVISETYSPTSTFRAIELAFGAYADAVTATCYDVQKLVNQRNL